MKKESWKQKLLRDTEIRLPEGRQGKSDAYLPPESADVVPHKPAWKRRLPYAAAGVAAAAVLVTGLSIHWHNAGPGLPAVEGTSGGVGTAASTAVSSRATELQTTSAAATTQASHTQTTQPNKQTSGSTASSAAVPVASAGELSLELAFTCEKVDGEFASYAQLADGGYVATGNTQAFADLRTPGNDQRSAMAVRYDAAGKIQYIRLFGGDGSDTFYKVIATRDGGFLACGNTSSTAGGDFDRSGIRGAQGGSTLIVKYDADGNVLWARTGASVRAHNITGYAADSVYETADGSLIGMVESYADDSKGIQYYRFHWDASGKPLTGEEYIHVDVPADHIADVRLKQDGGFVAVGNAEDNDAQAGLLILASGDGGVAIVKKYPYLMLQSLLPTDDGGYVVGGMVSRYTGTTDLQRAGITPPKGYRSKSSDGVIFMKFTADGALVGGDMVVSALQGGQAERMIALDGGEALFRMLNLGAFTDPLTGNVRPQSKNYYYRIDKNGKLAQLHTASSDLLVGVYNGLDGFIRQPDGSVRAVCLENSSPSYIRVLRLKSWG